jgi:serine/threonine-protein kinase RsbT
MTTVGDRLGVALNGAISEITRRSVIGRLGTLAHRPVDSLSTHERDLVLGQVSVAVRLFARGDKEAVNREVAHALPTPVATSSSGERAAPAGAAQVASTIAIRGEDDVAHARGEAWTHAVRLGFSRFSAIKVATAVSELARNIVFYAGNGSVSLEARGEAGAAHLHLVARDQGPGISAQKLAALADGSYRSERGMGQGLAAVRRLADSFDLQTAPGMGTTVTCTFRGQG